jgi:hypothetical protein
VKYINLEKGSTDESLEKHCSRTYNVLLNDSEVRKIDRGLFTYTVHYLEGIKKTMIQIIYVPVG